MDQVEVSVTAVVPASAASAVLTALSERCGSSGRQQRVWQRLFKSTLEEEMRGIGELRVLSDTIGGTHLLCTEGTERLAVKLLVVDRTTPCVEAHRVAKVDVSDNVPHLVSALGFELAYESLRRGQEFKQGPASISVFQLCRRREARDLGTDVCAGSDDEWETLGEGLRLVEVLVRGEVLAGLVVVADQWADVLAAIPDVALQPVPLATGAKK